MMMPKIIVVEPTTAVPISTGLAVALKVLPAPSPFSSSSLAVRKSGLKPKSFSISALDVRQLFDAAQFKDGLRVVRHRAEAVHGNRHRRHREKAKRHEAERENRRAENKFRRNERS